MSMKNNRIKLVFVNALLFAVLLTASLAPAQPASQSTSQTGDRYRIGPGDVLDIRIFNRPQLSRDAVRVEGDAIQVGVEHE